MKKLLLSINIMLCFLLLLNPAMIAGEENQNILTMEELSIKVMPEFSYHPNDFKKEKPPLLIGYQGTMRNLTEQPQKGKIELPLPMEETNFRIGYVADYSSDLSKVYEIEYIIDQKKGTISWTTSEEIQPNDVYKFVVEFYTDSIMTAQSIKKAPLFFLLLRLVEQGYWLPVRLPILLKANAGRISWARPFLLAIKYSVLYSIN
ncbi:hypothetical protein QFZ28_001550 [Neobacillus niacini]|uniref:hypothetical protein n=1 Tax=Neobacillus niacini TaxID=86668 RepID=UPI0027833D55|nr:hypothetical protein [Neobacillus niacini]MDQ1001150.1 hypothetical protein [Neobacillus niacini]